MFVISYINSPDASVTMTDHTHFTKEEIMGAAHQIIRPTLYINQEAEVDLKPKFISLQNSFPSMFPEDVFWESLVLVFLPSL